jgi:hypothetical protein
MSQIDPKLIIRLIERAPKRSLPALRRLAPLNISLVRFAGSQEYNYLPAEYPAYHRTIPPKPLPLVWRKGVGTHWF